MKQFLKDYGIYLITGVQALWAALAWWYHKSVATKDDVAAIDRKVGAAVQRIDSLEAARDNAPTKDDLAALGLEMADMRGDMRTFTAEVQGARDVFQAESQGLHRLVDRTETMVTTLTTHLLNKGH